MADQFRAILAMSTRAQDSVNRRRGLAPQFRATVAIEGAQENCRLFSLPGELRNRIYEYAFRVDHIQGIQYDGAVTTGKANNEYITMVNSKYTMAFETRDSDNWRDVPQQLSSLLSLSGTCRQIYVETTAMAFSENIFDVGLHAIQHFLAVVPRHILDSVKTISLWKNPRQLMDQLGDSVFFPPQNLNDIGVWRVLLRLLEELPALQKVILNVRGVQNIGHVRLEGQWEQAATELLESLIKDSTEMDVQVEFV